MKKLFVLFLTLLLCLTLIACDNKINKNDPQNNNTQNIDNSSNSNYGDGYTPDKNDNNSMFVYPDDPGQFVVDYMRKMATIEWTPSETFHLYGKYQAWNYNLTYERGQTYYGPPFLVNSRGSMQEFLGSVDEGVYVGGTRHSDCIGSACYDAVFVSLIQVCPSISFKSTEDMLPGNNTGLAAVGNWNAKITKHDTSKIIFDTSRQTMAQAYAQLLPGDVVLKHIVVQDAGHARIVCEKPHIVYKADKTINVEKSYITTIEQTNLWDSTVSIKTTWWVNRKYTFSDLINTYFVPLRPIDYTKELPQAYITSDNLITSDEIADAKKLKGTVSSNQYITELDISITNSDGIEIYNKTIYPNAKKVYLQDIKYTPKLYRYANGTYKFTISASLATGTKTLADYSFELDY